MKHEVPIAPQAVAFVTLGCAKNEVDTAHMRARVQEAGYAVVEDPACADAVVVNTCSFIQAATEESIEAVLEAADLPRVAAGEAALVVAGCMPARYGADLEAELPEARAFVPCAGEEDIVAVLTDAIGPAGGAEGAAQAQVSGAGALEPAVPFAYVKISDGCDRFCSYCTIPYIRGRYHRDVYKRQVYTVAKWCSPALCSWMASQWATPRKTCSTSAAHSGRRASRRWLQRCLSSARTWWARCRWKCLSLIHI